MRIPIYLLQSRVNLQQNCEVTQKQDNSLSYILSLEQDWENYKNTTLASIIVRTSWTHDEINISHELLKSRNFNIEEHGTRYTRNQL